MNSFNFILLVVSPAVAILLSTLSCWLFQGGVLFDVAYWFNVVMVLSAYFLSIIVIRSFANFPGSGSWVSILPSIGAGFGVVFGVVSLLDFSHSLSFFVIGMLVVTIFCYIDFFARSQRKRVMAFVPLGRQGRQVLYS